MKKLTSKTLVRGTVFFSSAIVLIMLLLLGSSFRVHKMADDFLKQLGITKVGVDEKITSSILGGSVDVYGLKNAKNIAVGNRKAVTLELLAYTKNRVNSAEFIRQYQEQKEYYKPKPAEVQSPEEMRAGNIAAAKKGVVDIEDAIKRADANTKPIFEKVLVDAQRNLKEMEDPNNKQYLRYASNYERLVKDIAASNEAQLANWEKKYPSNHLLYVKTRLEAFMEATKEIDFNAELITKNGKKYFVNPAYERKDNRWKMAFRAGKEVIEPARDFVQKWIGEIK